MSSLLSFLASFSFSLKEPFGSDSGRELFIRQDRRGKYEFVRSVGKTGEKCSYGRKLEIYKGRVVRSESDIHWRNLLSKEWIGKFNQWDTSNVGSSKKQNRW